MSEHHNNDAAVLSAVGVTISDESIDYVKNKTQFQLHTLLTEQRHPATATLSATIKENFSAGLQQILTVDQDITRALNATVDRSAVALLSTAIGTALRERRRIYVYGCGATGRLAKLVESTLWRTFIKILRRIAPDMPLTADDVIGEMTGADRALISSLEGFEDLLVIGQLQINQHKIQRGDVVICVSEGGETSSVIGTILAAHRQWSTQDTSEAITTSPPLPVDTDDESRQRLFFIYNNPDSVLLRLDRSRAVIECAGITKINLTTGPQAITGSTRMQATTIETFVIAIALHHAIYTILHEKLTSQQLNQCGFTTNNTDIHIMLDEFNNQILKPVQAALPEWSILTQWEYDTYKNNHFTTYYAESGLMTVFIDNTERSPTFRLLPLDTVHQEKRQCYVQIWTAATDHLTAWYSLLYRPFKGLDSLEYKKTFNETINDKFLLAAAMRSLPNASSEQQHLYDFSFAEKNIQRCAAKQGDLGVITLMYEELNHLMQTEQSSVSRFIRHMIDAKSRIVIIGIIDVSLSATTVRDEMSSVLVSRGIDTEQFHIALVSVSRENDPLRYRSQLALKILLNTHSTGVMARMGKVVHQTMTNVSPSNLKLIGRATALIQSHVNTALAAMNQSVSYQVCNTVLFDTITHIKNMSTTVSSGGQSAEVAITIIRILSSLHMAHTVSFDSALNILTQMSLEEYLSNWQHIKQ